MGEKVVSAHLPQSWQSWKGLASVSPLLVEFEGLLG
jgi:hypothetical protein